MGVFCFFGSENVLFSDRVKSIQCIKINIANMGNAFFTISTNYSFSSTITVPIDKITV